MSLISVRNHLSAWPSAICIVAVYLTESHSLLVVAQPIWFWFDFSLDCFFLVDMFVNFLTSFEFLNARGEKEFEVRRGWLPDPMMIANSTTSSSSSSLISFSPPSLPPSLPPSR